MSARKLYFSKAGRARQGSIIALVALLLPVLLILAAFAVNVAFLELSRTELRIAADSASRAAAYELMVSGSQTEARGAANEAGTRNQVRGKTMQFETQDVIFGRSSRANENRRYQFSPTTVDPNAVKVIGRRTQDSSNGMIRFLFPTFGSASDFGLTQEAIASHVDVDVVLVLDRSGSMAYSSYEQSDAMYAKGQLPAAAPPGWAFCHPVPPESRWLDLCAAVDAFVDALERSPSRELVSMASYATDAKVETQPTEYYSSLKLAMSNYTQQFCIGATNIGDGIKAGVAAIETAGKARSGAQRVMIVMTDGRHNTGLDPAVAARAAAAQGILIYTVTFSSEADQTRMAEVADIGGGEHYHALTRQQLIETFEEIATGFPNLLIE